MPSTTFQSAQLTKIREEKEARARLSHMINPVTGKPIDAGKQPPLLEPGEFIDPKNGSIVKGVKDKNAYLTAQGGNTWVGNPIANDGTVYASSRGKATMGNQSEPESKAKRNEEGDRTVVGKDGKERIVGDRINARAGNQAGAAKAAENVEFFQGAKDDTAKEKERVDRQQKNNQFLGEGPGASSETILGAEKGRSNVAALKAEQERTAAASIVNNTLTPVGQRLKIANKDGKPVGFSTFAENVKKRKKQKAEY